MLGNVQEIDIKLLRIFRTIVECGGFTNAQSALNMSASSISSYMSQLEQRMGGRLCERGHGAFSLTEHGRNVLAASIQLFSHLEEFRNEVAKSGNRYLGELRLGLIENSISHPDTLLSNTLSAFKQSAPDVTINIGIYDYYGLESKVADGHLHMAIGLCMHRYENLNYIPLIQVESLLYCGSEHPFYSKNDADLSEKDIYSINYVSVGDGETLFNDEWEFNEAGFSSNAEGIAYLILCGEYIGFLQTHYAEQWVERKMMRAIMPEKFNRIATYYLITSNNIRYHDIAQMFIKELTKDIPN